MSVAAGPLGREAEAKLRFNSRSGAVCCSYSASRGAFAGLALEGTVLRTRDAVNRQFYGRELPSKVLLLAEAVPPPVAAAALYDALDAALSQGGHLAAGGAGLVVEEGGECGRDGFIAARHTPPAAALYHGDDEASMLPGLFD